MSVATAPKKRSAEVLDSAKTFFQNMLHGIPPEHLTDKTTRTYIDKALLLADAWHDITDPAPEKPAAAPHKATAPTKDAAAKK